MSVSEELILLINKDLEFVEVQSLPLITKEGIPDLDKLHLQLCEKIEELLQKDFSRFLQLMYRIDIAEAALEKALATKDIGTVANLIIKREQAKLYWRNKYREK